MSQTIKCRGVVCWKPGSPFTLEEIEVSPPAKGQVRVKVVANSLCSSDFICLYSKEIPLAGFPIVPGHEATGIIESCGPDVQGLQPGDSVLIVWIYSCGKCYYCLNGNNLCSANPSFVPQDRSNSCLSSKGEKLYYMLVGSLSEYVVVSADSCIKLDPSMNLLKLTPLSCGFATGYGASNKWSVVNPNSTVAVWGLGAVGLAAGEGAANRKAAKIIGIDMLSNRFGVAKNLGFTHFINPSELPPEKDTRSQIMALTDNKGVDFAFVAVGSSKVFEEAMNCLKKNGGSITMIGFARDELKFSINPNLLLRNMRISGTTFGCSTFNDICQMVNDYKQGKIKLDLYTTHYAKLDDLNAALQFFQKGDAVRIVMILDDKYFRPEDCGLVAVC